MKTSATNRKIRVLLSAIRGGSLVPRPEFQRRLVWSSKHKSAFIETVLMGYPFPEIYIAAGEVDPDSGEGIEMLVDGQQRITTLNQYLVGSDDLRLGSDVRPYARLSDDEKLAFLEYEVVVRDLGKKSLEEIRQVFQRINSTKYSLNAMEIHNARFDGEFKKFGENLATHSFFENNHVFHTTEVRRMGDISFCLIFVITIMSSYFNRDSELETYLEKYNDEFEIADEISRQIERVFWFLEQCGLPPNSRAWKKADLLTLLVETHRALVKESKVLDPKGIRVKLEDFYTKVDQAVDGDEETRGFAEYHRAAIQATNDRSSRITRGRIWRRQILGEEARSEELGADAVR
jgi:Protein of unknown function DUF262